MRRILCIVAVVHTANPLQLGRVWQTKILTTISATMYSVGLVSGCVLCFLLYLRLYTDHCAIMNSQFITYIILFFGIVYILAPFLDVHNTYM